MNVLVLLIFASLGVALIFLASFVWAVRSGQYEDTATPSMRMLLDDTVRSEGARSEGPAMAPQKQGSPAPHTLSPSPELKTRTLETFVEVTNKQQS